MSVNKTESEIAEQFSLKRYFINNVDSYHGCFYLKEVAKLIKEKNALSTKETSQTMFGEDAMSNAAAPEQPYEIIATVSDPKIKSIDNVTRIIPKKECLPSMITCGTVILDISYDREELKIARQYMNLLKKLLDKQTPPDSSDAGDAPDERNDQMRRLLVLISTVMTWAMTKPMDPSTPDLPFIETDFRKRKPHPNYKVHYDVENEVIGVARKYKPLIGATVVCTGVTYGGQEDILFYWFQKAWECEKLLPILGRGANVVPIINIMDLAQIVHNLISDFPKKLYILAVEKNVMKQREIIKPIGRLLSTGMFKCIPPEDAFLIPEIDQRTFDLMTLNLNMEPLFIVETMALQWVSDLPFGENIHTLFKQYKKERGLKPFKVLIYGPPNVGKSILAKAICESYGLEYVSYETVAQDIMEDLAWRVKHWEEGETAALEGSMAVEENTTATSEDDTVTDEESQETAKQTLALLKSGIQLSEEEIIGYLRQRLLSKECQNRGWVLDGFPTNLFQCATLFDKGDEPESEAEDEKVEEQFDEDADLYANVLRKLLPDIVVSLEATDQFICEKAMRQTGDFSYLDEEEILKKLSRFRANDTPDASPLNFFDELDIHPLVVTVKSHEDYEMKRPYADVTLRMGRPCYYGKLQALIDETERKDKEEKKAQRHDEAKQLQEQLTKMQNEREDKMEYWSELYAVMRQEEEAALAVAGVPMRNYLVEYIFPTLTEALLEVAKLRPSDPIDFLAEYLFKQNPSGKMLEPGFNLQAEKLLGKIKIVDDALKDLEIKIDPLIPPEAEVSEAPKKSINPMSAM